MEIQVRLEQPSDYRAVEELTRDAFWGQFLPDADEHVLVHKLRKDNAFIPALDYVAQTQAGEIVGHILYSKAAIKTNEGKLLEVITFGPLSVHPAYQNKGIGRMLMEHTFDKARQLTYRAILIYGHADYYTRLGFLPAREYGIRNEAGMDVDAFMAMPLYENALSGMAGVYIENPIFEVDEQEKEAFDKYFPKKEKQAIPTLVDALSATLPKDVIKALGEKGLVTLGDIKRLSEREVLALPGMDEERLACIRHAMGDYGYTWGKKR